MTKPTDDIDDPLHDDRLHDACGVFAAVDPTGVRTDLSRLVYLGLFALQHRGQESAGIAVRQDEGLFVHKKTGLVVEAFDEQVLNILKGSAAIGHVRYATSGGGGTVNAQPLLMKTLGGPMALAHNGNLVDAEIAREALEAEGALFRTLVDSETLLYLIARSRILGVDLPAAVRDLMQKVHGAYSVVLLTPDSVAAFRDPLGIRPLCMGRLGDVVLFASESCAIEACGGTFERDLLPGEIVVLDAHGIHADLAPAAPSLDALDGCAFVPCTQGALCSFEFVYFARPDSALDGASVDESRHNAGLRLAEEHPCVADLVIGAPDSGLTAALGFSERSGIPYGSGLLKNRYVGRTFIQPSQHQRESAVNLKFSVLRRAVEGLRVVLVDDSIVRGTTMQRVIRKLRDAGAAEVHMRIASPPVRHPCYYGIDTPDTDELIANHADGIEGVRLAIGADSLGYLSQEGLVAATSGLRTGLCTSCFDGSYPAGRVEPPSGVRGACCGALNG